MTLQKRTKSTAKYPESYNNIEEQVYLVHSTKMKCLYLFLLVSTQVSPASDRCVPILLAKPQQICQLCAVASSVNKTFLLFGLTDQRYVIYSFAKKVITWTLT